RTYYFARHGYVVVSVQYRSSAQAKWPAQIIDIKTAIRWVRKHADDYQIDVNHIGIMGRSAGSHIAVMAAMNEEDKSISNEYSEYSSSVQAC
ncbi:alpha/beta hydrolase fold domain-containing protein, partial [Desulfocurvus sp. DL9XJH121]